MFRDIDLETDWRDERLHEESGIFGMYDLSGGDVSQTVYYGLCALSSREPESCGISVSDSNAPNIPHVVRGLGRVDEVFDKKKLNKLKGNLSIGHIRYYSDKKCTIENSQPLVLNYVKGSMMIAQNACLLNGNSIREELAYTGSIFQGNIDSEALAYLFAKERIDSRSVEEAVTKAVGQIRGAYSIVVASPRKLIGARDPYGFRPLCIGRIGNAFILTTESAALDTVGAEFIRDVLPGEVVAIDHHGINSDKSMCIEPEKQARCVFEYLYFARPDSYIDGVSVYNSRIKAGQFLAIDSPVDADMVVGVPDSGITAALGYSLQSGIPYGTAFVKNNFISKKLVDPDEDSSITAVNVHLNALKEAVRGKRIVLIDDSVIRGRTSGSIVKLLKDAGATEVHVRVSAPPVLYFCHFGTDIPEKEELIAYNRTVEEIREKIGADSLAYLGLERLIEIAGGNAICQGCLTGEYPIAPPRKK